MSRRSRKGNVRDGSTTPCTTLCPCIESLSNYYWPGKGNQPYSYSRFSEYMKISVYYMSVLIVVSLTEIGSLTRLYCSLTRTNQPSLLESSGTAAPLPLHLVQLYLYYLNNYELVISLDLPADFWIGCLSLRGPLHRNNFTPK